MKIALDVMGGDFAPDSPIKGAVLAQKKNNISIVLVGDEKIIKKELDKIKFNSAKTEIVHASEQIEMGEAPVQALRAKKDSSIRVAYNLHKAGDVDAVVSAGNSGAMLAIGKFVLKTIKGIDRPCISAVLPSRNSRGRVVLLDAGANMDCTPKQLLDFAVLGDVYASELHHVKTPRVALLNIGSEEGKGDERSKEAFKLLKDSPINFIGNIEGKDIFNADIDVVVADGFSGNVLLKSVQGGAKFVSSIIKDEIDKSIISKIGALIMRRAFERLKVKIDYASYGGAPLLGLKGVGIVCHGVSNEHAIAFGVNYASWAAKANLVPKVEEKVNLIK